MKLWNLVDGKKSYIVACVTILYAVVVVGFGQGDWSTAGTLVLGGAGLGALRHGVAKG